ncbi:hypothetical protein D3C85_1806940 [compost metagenome]
MRGDDAGFERDTEVLQHARGVLHDFPVAVATHHDANFDHGGGFHQGGEKRDFT